MPSGRELPGRPRGAPSGGWSRQANRRSRQLPTAICVADSVCGPWGEEAPVQTRKPLHRPSPFRCHARGHVRDASRPCAGARGADSLLGFRRGSKAGRGADPSRAIIVAWASRGAPGQRPLGSDTAEPRHRERYRASCPPFAPQGARSRSPHGAKWLDRPERRVPLRALAGAMEGRMPSPKRSGDRSMRSRCRRQIQNETLPRAVPCWNIRLGSHRLSRKDVSTKGRGPGCPRNDSPWR